MAATLELKYFNSYWLKKIKTLVDANTTSGPAVPASPYNDVPRIYSNTNPSDWYIEEARIRGGYNNTITDLGVKAHIVEDNPNNQNRFNTIIYSGVFNSRTGVNQTNEFSVGEDITRSVDPAHGSIQKLYAEDTNLIIFQEDKINRALIDKDAIYSAEGNAAITSANVVIGQIVPYQGEYGISTDPTSFAIYGYRKYFTDRKRGCVLRLSSAGEIIEISGYGMHDFFRDQLTATNVSKVVGGWDMHTKNYILSIQTLSTSFGGQTGGSITPAGTDVTLTLNAANPDVKAGMYIYQYTLSGQVVGELLGRVRSVVSSGNPSSFKCDITNQIAASATIAFQAKNYETLSFDESVQGWTSLLTYKPSWMFSLSSTFFTTNSGKLYQHYGSANYCEFYDLVEDSDVTVVLNAQPSTVKVFQTINYEGSGDWTVSSLDASSGDTALVPVSKYILPTSLTDFSNELFTNSFKRKENKYFANILNNSSATSGEVIFGNNMTGIKGFFSTVKFSLSNVANQRKELFAVSSETVESSY